LRALSDVSLAVEPGERRLIIGPNGAGKTTLFNILSGALTASSGKVMLFDRDITQSPAYERAKMGLARTFQITNVFPRLTVMENLLLALQAAEQSGFCLHRRMRDNRALCAQANALLDQWNLRAIPAQPAKAISYGEQRQLDLIWPWRHNRRSCFWRADRGAFRGRGRARREHGPRPAEEITILMIEHDMDVAFDLAERITVLHRGCVIAEGDVETIRKHPQVTEIYLGAD
jgi:branched-chain amino acid transport system ATP-binding protein